jgi:hypothetical protein
LTITVSGVDKAVMFTENRRIHSSKLLTDQQTKDNVIKF